MPDFGKRKLRFAVVFVAVAGGLLLISGFTELTVIGFVACIGGAADFLFTQGTRGGWIASEVYGEAGEELWSFRSFLLMAGGPLLILYSILF